MARFEAALAILLSIAALIVAFFFVVNAPRLDGTSGVGSRLDGITTSLRQVSQDQAQVNSGFRQLEAAFNKYISESGTPVRLQQKSKTSTPSPAPSTATWPYPPGESPYSSLPVVNKSSANDLLYNNKYGVNDDEKRAAMTEWMRRGGGTVFEFDLIALRRPYRGVHSKRAHAKDETILYLPLSHLIQTQVAQKSAIGRAFEKAEFFPDSFSLLAVYILFHRWNPDSFFGPYIASLPQDYSYIPIFWDDSELVWLNGSVALSNVKWHRESLDNYHELVKHLPELSQFTYDEYCWARTVVQTRAFEATVNDIKGDALIPIADMFNHHRPADTEWEYLDKKKHFEVKLTHDIPQRGEICHSYGDKCQTSFLVNYGFIAPNNHENDLAFFELDLDSEPDILFRSSKVKHIGKTEECWLYLEYLESTLDCFSWARTAVFAAPAAKDMTFYGAISLKNEMKALGMMTKKITESLSYFTQTLEQDREFLQQHAKRDPSTLTGKDIRRLNAVQVTKSEKEIFYHYLLINDLVNHLYNYLYNDSIPLFFATTNPIEGYYLKLTQEKEKDKEVNPQDYWDEDENTHIEQAKFVEQLKLKATNTKKGSRSAGGPVIKGKEAESKSKESTKSKEKTSAKASKSPEKSADEDTPAAFVDPTAAGAGVAAATAGVGGATSSSTTSSSSPSAKIDQKLREWFFANVWSRDVYVQSYFQDAILPLFPQYQSEVKAIRKRVQRPERHG